MNLKISIWFHNQIKVPILKYFSKRRVKKIFKHYDYVLVPDNNSALDFEFGELVFDNLTARLHRITKILYNGKGKQWGYFIDSIYLGGGRESWEIAKIIPRKKK